MLWIVVVYFLQESVAYYYWECSMLFCFNVLTSILLGSALLAQSDAGGDGCPLIGS